MAGHRIYKSMIDAVRANKLKEPFTSDDFRIACPGFAVRTYSNFLSKHRVGNPSGTSELFIRVSEGKFKLLRPFKYGLQVH